jgi:hypothetical protein
MISLNISETGSKYILELPDYVKTVKQLKNNILSFKTNYYYDNIKLILIDDNLNETYLLDEDEIYDQDTFILVIVPIIL